MKNTLVSNRLKAIITIGFVAIGIGVISKKVISFPDCSIDAQKITNLNKI